MTSKDNEPKFIVIIDENEYEDQDEEDASFAVWDLGDVFTAAESLSERDRLALISWIEAEPLVGKLINVSFGMIIRAPSGTPKKIQGWGS